VLAVLEPVLMAPPSLAHSQEVASDPADKSKVSIVPAAVTMTFNENVLRLGTKVLVTGPAGNVTKGAPTVLNNVVRQALSADSPAGAYTVQWRVTSADGHPVSGKFTFTAARGASTQPATPSPSETTAPQTTAPQTTAPAVAPASGGTGMSGLTVIGIAALVLAVLLAVGWILRSRR
jgi:methionine-rich copper-binding protein CopC